MRPEIAEQATREPADHEQDDVRTTAHATGVLVLALRVPVTAAETALHAAARRYRVSVGDLATAVASIAAGDQVTDRELATVVQAEWGDLLA